jgi:hypothetical protein
MTTTKVKTRKRANSMTVKFLEESPESLPDEGEGVGKSEDLAVSAADVGVIVGVAEAATTGEKEKPFE